MIINAFMKALDQSFEKGFRRVFFVGVLGAVIVFAALLFFITTITPQGFEISSWQWVNDAVNWMLGFALYPMFFIVAWLFFPAVATMFMGIFLDDVVDAVEDKHYPDHKAPHRISVMDSFLIAAKMGLLLIVLNLLALPLYLLLLFTAVGPFILFLTLNSYLLGREYFDLVAMRHFSRTDAIALRESSGSKAFLTGTLITILYIIPIVNLFAPILGAATMVHVFHSTRSTRGSKV
ncbi:MAG: EI24 domain-containing protein [Sphingomonadales bacterium]|nr:EI24 domain-containing protein [Sphingomonadales bacterium]